MKSRKVGLARDEAIDRAVLGTFGRHRLRASVLEPALRDDGSFGNIMGRWRVGSLVISVVSDRGQWFAGVSTAKAHGQRFNVSDIATLLGLERPSPDPPQSIEPLIELIAANFVEIETLFSRTHFDRTKRELEAILARREEEIKNRLEAIAAGAAATWSQKHQ
jgi:hypothetical protein